MDELEKYIRENRDAFDLAEPREGHFERFAGKMEKTAGTTSPFRWRYFLQAAVIAVLVILSSLWIYDRVSGPPDGHRMITLSDISAEYREAEIFYTSMINRKYEEIKSFDFHDNSLEQEMLLNELSEMDAVYRSLQEELSSEKGNQMIINAMIRHYQLKLEIMSRIIDHLYEIKNGEQSKTEDNEYISI